MTAGASQPRLTLRDQVAEAWSTCSVQGARSVGTILAMALGVAAVTATLNISYAASQQVSDRFDAVRATEVFVADGRDTQEADSTVPAFPADVDSRLLALAGVVSGGVVGEHGTLELRSHFVGDADDSGRHDVEVMSATPGGLAALRPEVRGRPLAAFDQDSGHRVVLLGRGVVDDIGGAFPAGRTVFIDGLAFTVIGVIDDVVRVHDVLRSVVVPERVAADLFPPTIGDRRVVIDVLPGAAAQVGAQAPAAIAPEAPQRYLVALPPEPASLRLDVQEELASLVLAVALIVAAVAGIGIANSTLVGVIARTPELGLKRAIGARPSHLYRLVATESVLLGAIGGVVGTFLGLMGTMAVIIANGWLPIVDVRTLVMGPLIGVTIGALAGCWPAWRAARIEPTAALRH